MQSEDLESARAVDRQFHQEQVPEAPGELSQLGQELQHCPACNTALASGDTECRECGLCFPEASDDDRP